MAVRLPSLNSVILFAIFGVYLVIFVVLLGVFCRFWRLFVVFFSVFTWCLFRVFCVPFGALRHFLVFLSRKI